MTRDRRPTLRARLVASYAAVIAAGLATLAVAIRLLDPVILGARTPGPHRGPGARGLTHAAFYDALNWAIVAALAVGLVVAALVAHRAVRRILRPLDAVRSATRRLSAGRYGERVEPPMERELAALAEDVNHLAEALESTERRRARLMGDLAHELRTPLTALRGLLEGALDGVLEVDGSLLGSALEETGRLERLAGDLAQVSRAEEGRLDLEPRAVDLAALAERAGERLRSQFVDKGVHLELVRAGPLPAIADPDRIVQVATNLLGNALRATPPGGTVTVEAAAAPGAVRLAVRDTGVGLAPEHLARVFERFWRGPSPGGHGTGIGLTIARAIAEAHGGTLTAASPGPGRGATFVLSLPSTPARPAAAPPQPPSPPVPRRMRQRRAARPGG